MDLSFFTMPIHPVGKSVAQSLREDREAFILADELGFVEGYCGDLASWFTLVMIGLTAILAAVQ